MIVVAIDLQKIEGDAVVSSLLDSGRSVSGVPANAEFSRYASNDRLSLFLVDLFAHEQASDVAARYRERVCNNPSGLPTAPSVQIYALKPRDVVSCDVPETAVSICAILHPAPKQSGALFDLLLEMMAETRREPGNFYYNLFESSEDGSLWMFESYVDAAALQRHRSSSYYQTHVPKIAAMLSAPIKVLTMTDANVPRQ
jgi:quinol monooxygenase YgiN